MCSIEFSDQDIVHLIIALERDETALLEDEENGGPSYTDSVRVENILRRLRAARQPADSRKDQPGRVADD